MDEGNEMERNLEPVTPEALYISGLTRLFGNEALAEAVKGGAEKAEGKTTKDFARLGQWLLTVTDAAGADGLSLEAGREAFDLLLRDHGEEIGLQDTELRMLPMRRRARKGFEVLAAWFAAAWGWESSVTLQTATLSFELQSAGGLAGQELQHPFCHFVEGLLQGLLFWASGGRYYEVKSAGLPDSGRPVCQFAFSNTPID